MRAVEATAVPGGAPPTQAGSYSGGPCRFRTKPADGGTTGGARDVDVLRRWPLVPTKEQDTTRMPGWGST